MKTTGRNEQTKPRSTRTALILVAVLILFVTVVLNSYRLPAYAQEDTRAVSNVVIESNANGEAAVTWDPPTDDPHDYRINWTEADQEGFPSYTEDYGNAYPIEPTYTITDLTPGVRYKIRLRARYNGSGRPLDRRY